MSRVKGLDKLLNELKKLPKEAEDDLADAVQFSALAIEKDAKIRAPKDMGAGGGLVSGIKAEQWENRLTWRVTAYKKWSAYMEFGTGGLVQIPSELLEEAARFKGAGIREVNLRPQPYLYPALVAERKRFLDRVKKLVGNLGSKI